MNKLKSFLQRIYRLTLSYQKQEELVWSDLKKNHTEADWTFGVYEKDKYIETNFNISVETAEVFYHMIYDSRLHCRVKILRDFSSNLTTDIFILASHFNNILVNGVVKINVNKQFVEYHEKIDLLIPLLYKGEIYAQINRHHQTTEDIYSAFQRLVNENEAPAIIMADMFRANKKNNENKE